jgi:hypothetical protein
MIHCTYLQEVCLLGYLIIDRKCNKLLLYIFIRPHQHILTGKYQIISHRNHLREKFYKQKKIGIKESNVSSERKTFELFSCQVLCS